MPPIGAKVRAEQHNANPLHIVFSQASVFIFRLWAPGPSRSSAAASSLTVPAELDGLAVMLFASRVCPQHVIRDRNDFFLVTCPVTPHLSLRAFSHMRHVLGASPAFGRS